MHPSPCSSPCDPPSEGQPPPQEAGLTTAALIPLSILGTPMLPHQCRFSIHSTFSVAVSMFTLASQQTNSVFKSLTSKHWAGTRLVLGTEQALHAFSTILSAHRAHSYKTAFTINPLLYVLSICLKLFAGFSKLNESARAHKRPL